MCYQDLFVICRRCGRKVKVAPLDHLPPTNRLYGYLADERHGHECLDTVAKIA